MISKRSEVKEKQKQYRQRPEVKKRMKEYHQRPEQKEKRKQYYQRRRVEDKILSQRYRAESLSHESFSEFLRRIK